MWLPTLRAVRERTTGHEGIALHPSSPMWNALNDPHLVFPQMRGWAAVETSHKKEDLISLHQRALKHRAAGDQIVRPDPIDRHDCRFWIQICQSLQDVSDALTSCFGPQSALEGSTGNFDFLGDLFRCEPPARRYCHRRRSSSPSGFSSAVPCVDRAWWPPEECVAPVPSKLATCERSESWSDVMPEPRRALLKQTKNSTESSSNCSAG